MSYGLAYTCEQAHLLLVLFQLIPLKLKATREGVRHNSSRSFAEMHALENGLILRSNLGE